jgi:hypothetical protein
LTRDEEIENERIEEHRNLEQMSTGISNRFFRLSEGLDTAAGDSCASAPGTARSFGLMLFFVMKLMRRMYLYTQTSSVSSIVAKKGPKIAVCAMLSSLVA